MNDLRIVSLLPSATEMVCALGLENHLLAVTHECDYPPGVANKPIVVRNVLPLDGLSPREIDSAVAAQVGQGASLYRVDERVLQELAPTLILTQDLCQVCAPSGREISRVMQSLKPRPRLLCFSPKSISDIEANVRELGELTGRSREAEAVIASGRWRLHTIGTSVQRVSRRPRVFFMEWVDPVYCSGHWVPEMVELAGGKDALGRAGADSTRLDWKRVMDWAPEVLIIGPCGFNLAGAVEQSQHLSAYAGWTKLPAVEQNRVYVVDANSYFARPGPRVVDGVELLAHLIHPELHQWTGPDAFARLQF